MPSSSRPCIQDRIKILIQQLLPKQALTVFAGKMAAMKLGGLTTAFIGWYARHYGVQLEEAQESDPSRYACFQDFFTRPIRPELRPVAETDFVCPVDGCINQCGPIEGHQIFQAKGQSYSIAALLGGTEKSAEAFAQGSFATLYLSPGDYHRIHMPCDGRLKLMTHIPGKLYTVNPTTANNIPNLFARNERVVCLFESSFGPFAMVLVGATIVGSMTTIWHGVVNAERPATVRQWPYQQDAVVLKKGEEMGHFSLGSTVILLFPKNTLALNPQWREGRTIRMGESMGNLLS
nr:archaetidylserine decarboxylase [uncultured Desulfobulbus sp.]